MEQGTILFDRSPENASGGYLEGRLDYTALPDLKNNARILTLRLFCRKGNDRMTLTVATVGSWHYSFRVGNLPIEGATPGDTRILTEWVQIARVELTVPNEKNGLFTATLAGSITPPVGSSYENLKIHGEETVVFGKMERIGMLLYAPDCHFGNLLSFRMQPRCEGFYYGAKLSIGNFESELFPISPTSLSPETFSLPLPLSAAAEIPNSSLGELSLSLLTFADSARESEIGRESVTVNAILDRTDDTLPDLSIQLFADNSSLPDALSGIFIRGITRVLASFTTSPKLGATIESRILEVAGSEDTLVQSSGEVNVTATVYDSRGFSQTVSRTVTVLPYGPPELLPPENMGQIGLFRCDKDGKEHPNLSHLCLAARARCASLAGKNAPVFRYRVKCEDGAFGEWMPLAGVENAILENAVPDPARSYTLELCVTDLVGKSHTVTLRVPAGNVDFHLGKGGAKAAFGMFAQRENALEIAPHWQLFLGGAPVFDTVTEARFLEDEGIYLRKWKNGRCEMFLDPRTFTPTDALVSGSLHVAQCRLTLPLALTGAIVSGSSEDCLIMGGECYGSDLLVTVASGEAFDASRTVTLRLSVCGALAS